MLRNEFLLVKPELSRKGGAANSKSADCVGGGGQQPMRPSSCIGHFVIEMFKTQIKLTNQLKT